MDAKQFFDHVIAEHYEAWNADRTNFAKLWSVAQSINSIAERLAIHREAYRELSRDEVDEKAEAIVSQYPVLGEIKSQAKTERHGRSHKGQQVTASSTGVVPNDPKTFADLADVVDRAYTTLTEISALK